ncbi:NAD(P)/FAD-dependent oxidoreductase [Actinotalea sp.]|uniref:type III sulfide quinone reductase, selenoprotein subtype n=1 Tax=Actinotalea sp. TaxID=1872145 RepID=UPI00356642BF
MRHLVVLGAGTAGTMVVNKLRPKLGADWAITIVDPSDLHYYQPGFLFLPFGTYAARDVVKPMQHVLAKGIDLVKAAVDRVDAENRTVHLEDGSSLDYDYLVIATGTTPRPDQTPGMAEAMGTNVHEFYTYDGAMALRKALETFRAGRLVLHITEMPIKCPVAPLEFAFLADSFFTEKGVRDKVELTYVTPLPGAFTKPVSAKAFGDALTQKGIELEPDFVVEHVDGDAGTLVSYDEREVPFDLLVTIPLNMGADYVGRSGFGDDLNYVPVDRQTLLSTFSDRVFAVGDANNIPASKAGAVAHFAVDGFVPNFLAHIEGKPMTHLFDGHANCFIESGHGKALLIDFNYDTEPLTGVYPYAKVGPLSLLKETRLNHIGKLAFRWIYWHILMPGRHLPVPIAMSMAGKTPAGTSESSADTDTDAAPIPSF